MPQHYINADDESKPNTLPTLWATTFGLRKDGSVRYTDKPGEPEPLAGADMLPLALQAARLATDEERRAFIEQAFNAPYAEHREALVAWEGEARECPCNHDDGGDLDDHSSACAGWYICVCIPGCMPDSDWHGPYATEEAAVTEMRAFLAAD